MNLFETVKVSVSVPDAAKMYGLQPNHHGMVKQIIFDDISEWKESGVARKVDDLLKTIKLMAYSEDIPLHYDRIHVANGTWYLDGRFTGDKEYCRNRLMVDYNPDADMPGVWLRFLSELLIPEDILTLQEYMGYCLIPTTKAQKMLMLIGKGGEGNLPNACNASDQPNLLFPQEGRLLSIMRGHSLSAVAPLYIVKRSILE